MFDESKYNSIVGANYRTVLAYCIERLSFDRDAAQETADDVMIVLYKKWDQIDPDSDIRMWLFRVADNCILMRRRKHRRTYDRETSLDERSEAGEEMPSEGFEEEVTDRILAEELTEKILAALPEKYHPLFKLRYEDGMNASEISRGLGMHYTTVRLRLKKVEETVRRIAEQSET